MEIHNTHEYKINPDQRYAVTFTLTSGQKLGAVLRGSIIFQIRVDLMRRPADRSTSVAWESDDVYFLPTSNIAYMSVSKTNINCNPNTISYVDGP